VAPADCCNLVATEVNGDSKRINERVYSWFVQWTCRDGTRDFCSALAALNTYFLTVHCFNSLSPSLGHAGSPVSVLLVRVSGHNRSEFCKASKSRQLTYESLNKVAVF
jgi:hypothetical protein